MNIKKLQGVLAEKDYTKERLAAEMGIDRSTIYRKFKNQSFTLKEAREIKHILQLSDKMANIIFFG
ncbi:phBC6A51 family helix-turn-helix protein [Limosilactobacillus antri]|uniref:phBC6A51 family helix-turn-helix protein n=1 Tax=Limosilactobacillus antri TaxID=227943 RepID=UPI001F56F1B0|nr:helix-turn-helix domain-containing protein [Limosilactobacillus antri]